MAIGLDAWMRKWRTWAARWLSAGARGERLAAHYLSRRKGYAILARNWRSLVDQRDELDLVCRDGAALVFVEVKWRSATAMVSGYFAVDRRKRKALLRVAKDYLHRLPADWRPATIRFDIVEIAGFRDGRAEVRHYENVPLFAKDYWP